MLLPYASKLNKSLFEVQLLWGASFQTANNTTSRRVQLRLLLVSVQLFSAKQMIKYGTPHEQHSPSSSSSSNSRAN
jgi:hypothetical protein